MAALASRRLPLSVSASPDQITISAINRNFPGRSGPGKVWLGSPYTVAASALAGHITTFDQLREAAWQSA
jgi:3-isopropylmalate/(R)-2-methylmalate dehydratase large subunit